MLRLGGEAEQVTPGTRSRKRHLPLSRPTKIGNRDRFHQSKRRTNNRAQSWIQFPCLTPLIPVMDSSMSQTFIRSFNNRNVAILAGDKPVERIYFNLVRLMAGESYHYRLPEFESVIVPMAGTCDLTADG